MPIHLLEKGSAQSVASLKSLVTDLLLPSVSKSIPKNLPLNKSESMKLPLQLKTPTSISPPEHFLEKQVNLPSMSMDNLTKPHITIPSSLKMRPAISSESEMSAKP